MGKPRLIILIRHAQSEGNKNREVHQTLPDHRVPLTSEGWSQAYDAGRRLRELLDPKDKLHFFISPYRRTRETTEGILSTLTNNDPSPSPFPREKIKVYEEPRLREQDFGNFQPCSAEVERIWQERADYGHFFYRIPNGESAADAYDRISGFNESLWRQFGEDDFASVCILVTHGLMSRIFLMKWYHFSVEYFEDLRNVNHCEFLIMRKDENNGKYILENRLRTWSELRKNRKDAAIGASSDVISETSEDTGTIESIQKDEVSRDQDFSVNDVSLQRIPFRQKWGGCPDGCDHIFPHNKRDKVPHLAQGSGRVNLRHGQNLTKSYRPLRQLQSSDEEEDDHRAYPVGYKRNSVDSTFACQDDTSKFHSRTSRAKFTMKLPNSDNSYIDDGNKSLSNEDITNGSTSPTGSDYDSSAEEESARNNDILSPKKHHVFRRTSSLNNVV